MKLNFKVEGQSIICLNREVLAAEAVNFVWAAFIFDEDWMGLSKTAYFENISTGVNIAQVLSASGECKVPYEVLAQPGRLSVTVRGVWRGRLHKGYCGAHASAGDKANWNGRGG